MQTIAAMIAVKSPILCDGFHRRLARATGQMALPFALTCAVVGLFGPDCPTMTDD